MKIDINQVIRDLRGKAIKDRSAEGEEDTDATLGGACINALTSALPGDNPDGKEKFKRFGLAQRILDALEEGDGVVDLKAEEVTLLKDLTGKAFPVEVLGAIWTMLEAVATPAKK